jgi:hypothetical protein
MSSLPYQRKADDEPLLGRTGKLQFRARVRVEVRLGAVKKFPEFFDTDGLVYRESVPLGQSVTESSATSDRQGHRFLHRATHRLLCHHPATALCGSRSE